MAFVQASAVWALVLVDLGDREVGNPIQVRLVAVLSLAGWSVAGWPFAVAVSS